MTLGELREKTKTLSDETVVVIFIEQVLEGDSIVREEIEAPVNSLDIDKGVDGEFILTLTDGEKGSYSL